ncbi:silent information regulator protein Sir2p [Pseudovirgaria hyperparasitica]|uniref:Silent information regulator protein Sir2p n=1 Tax=Pseudovirgaria hyperparasitica TaxID=470096 RepID=A0A6A6WFS7_9PEZI|nr:silent information regulator protein Sir2p [Pseudovirgaria hyperparasitica]KAF2760766.1 silent information regulator protein Sir2p [Pseudovirgaria hyperparasitica]
MSKLHTDFKAELRTRANESLKRHFEREEHATRNVNIPPPSEEMIKSFTEHLIRSKRILALIGAGLSAASGIPTYRGAGGFWRSYSDIQLATKTAFDEDPSLVWQFYNYRRHQALTADPNSAHHALAELAKRKPGFLAVNQNIDGLCRRVGHPPTQIIDLHGSLFRVKCSNEACGYNAEDYNDPITPALSLTKDYDNDVTKADIPLAKIDHTDLPICPLCTDALLRPAVVWFGESIPADKASGIDKWLAGDTFNQATAGLDSVGGQVDLMLVVRTSAVVYPAAAYIQQCRKRGARVAFFNMEVAAAGAARPEPGDWSFQGDASKLIPQALRTYLELSDL